MQEKTEYLSWLRKYLEETYKKPILENFLDLHMLDIEEGKAKLEYTVKDMQTNFYGFAHGGVLASICDIVMGVSCITLDKQVVTIDMNTSYIKNVPIENTLTAKGEVISDGKKIIQATGEIYHNKQLLVKAQASYFVKGNFYKNNM